MRTSFLGALMCGALRSQDVVRGGRRDQTNDLEAFHWSRDIVRAIRSTSFDFDPPLGIPFGEGPKNGCPLNVASNEHNTVQRATSTSSSAHDPSGLARQGP